MQTLEALSTGRDNSFDLVRFLAASAVILAHAYPLSGTPSALIILPSYNLGGPAVAVFFGLSGFLITKSYLRTRSIIEFSTARFMRLVPGLAVMLALTVLLLGAAVSTAPLARYFGSHETWSYAAHNLILWDIRYTLPGVFIDNPYEKVVNGSIWTLPHEVRCYTVVALLGLAGFLKGWRAALPASAYIIAYLAFREPQNDLPPQWEQASLPFFLGCIFYLLRKRIPLHPVVLAGVIGITALLWQTSVALEMFVLALIYAVFYFGSLPIRAFRRFGQFGDFSYGIYIYGFPIEQTVAFLWKDVPPLALAATTFLVTLPLAILSWHFVEKPALDQRHAIGRMLATARPRVTSRFKRFRAPG